MFIFFHIQTNLIVFRLVSAFQDKVIDSLNAKHMKGPAIVREAMQKAKDRVHAGKKFNATALFKHFVHQVPKVKVLTDYLLTIYPWPGAGAGCGLREAQQVRY